ncbi:MAG TPA: GGDEF domain-containing protein [Kofleriaceae bacterium]|nr:GGDEF domain-containing protein [Kofleriaceae bacterium]
MASGDDWDEEPTATTNLADVAVEAERERHKPSLTVMTGPATGTMFKLARGASVIGRAPNCEIKLVDEGISRHHARLRHEGDKLFVEDMQSRNGTFVNGVRATKPVQLKEGDKLQIGRSTILKFALQDELDAQFHEALLSSALRDPLTRLYNKRYLMDRLDSELKFARRHETTMSVLMMDIDHFKQINDTHGHLAGDALLSQLAATLSRAVRNEDVVARFGGEEVVVILRAISLELAAQLGDRLRRLVENTVVAYQGLELRATISVGVAGYPSTRAETVEQLLEAADKALYRAKRAGRNRVAR